ncbi:hypothetical protein [Bacillus sp. REN3]|uniref:hypothetical protein n=1 Tax=Bacillus sp. REN3 TaxID=2802440 RepID=UPI001AED89FF|nr:hypothetical protein [Bacillus sp. REN3]
MNIAYVVAEGLDKEHGVSKKILNQITCWINEGHKVKLFYFSNKEINSMFNRIDYKVIKYKNRVQFVLSTNGIDSIRDWKPDIVYFRFYLFSRKFYTMAKKHLTIVEINSDDVKESKVQMSFPIRCFHLITRELLLRNVEGFVSVTEELKRKFSKYNKKIITIPNGVDSPFVGRSLENKCKDRLEVVFMGSPNQSWHGLDKIHFIAKNLPSFDFHVIGTKEIENPPSNLKQYGYLTKDEYVKILKRSDVAIGTLALHRKEMNEACPLKTREYLKYGLPTIIGYIDSDFVNKQPNYLLQLPNTENNVINNIDTIKKFIEQSHHIKVRKEGLQYIFNDYKERKRLNFFDEFLK